MGCWCSAMGGDTAFGLQASVHFSTLQVSFLFFCKKLTCLKVLIPSVLGGYYSPWVAGISPLLEKAGDAAITDCMTFKRTLISLLPIPQTPWFRPA